MALLIAEHRLVVVVCATLAIAFLWLDVALYFRVQSMATPPPPPMELATGTTVTAATSPMSSKRPQPHIYSPFKGLSVKMVMMDPINNYIFGPLGELFNDVTGFSRTFSFVSADMVSYAGLAVAIVASRLVADESFLVRRVAVLVFQVRTFLDALDGIVARDHQGITKHISQVGTSGYIVDGACDTIGFAAFLLGCWLFLRKSVPRQCKYIPLVELTTTSSHYQHSQPSSGGKSLDCFLPTPTQRHIVAVTACFAVQLAASATFWNYFLDRYHTLLESEPATPQQTEVLKSSMTWSVMWFWRVLNAHALMQYLLFAVFVNRTWEFLLWCQWPGLVAVGSLAVLSQAHVWSVETYLSHQQ